MVLPVCTLDQRPFIQENDEDDVLEWHLNGIPYLHGDNCVIQLSMSLEYIDEEPYLLESKEAWLPKKTMEFLVGKKLNINNNLSTKEEK